MDLIRICKAQLQSVSPYSSSRMFVATKLHENETPGAVQKVENATARAQRELPMAQTLKELGLFGSGS